MAWIPAAMTATPRVLTRLYCTIERRVSVPGWARRASAIRPAPSSTENTSSARVYQRRCAHIQLIVLEGLPSTSPTPGVPTFTQNVPRVLIIPAIASVIRPLSHVTMPPKMVENALLTALPTPPTMRVPMHDMESMGCRIDRSHIPGYAAHAVYCSVEMIGAAVAPV